MKEGIRKIFSEVPHSYELVKHILIFGLDIFWRRKAAKIAAEGGGGMWIDICSGTGEMAFCLYRLAPERTQVFAVDFALPIVDQALKKKDAHKIFFMLSDINTLPFPDKTFDLVTISFATRNINLNKEGLLQSLQEIKRQIC